MFILSNLVQANRDLATAYVHLVTHESNQGYDYTCLLYTSPFPYDAKNHVSTNRSIKISHLSLAHT